MTLTVGAIAALISNVLLLTLPTLILAPDVFVSEDVPFACFLILATGAFLAELSRFRFGNAAGPAVTMKVQRKVIRLALLTGIVMLGILWIAQIERVVISPRTSPGFVVTGSALMASGIVLRYLSIRTLGRFFVTEHVAAAGQPLVQSGVFRYLRHPSETGILAIVIGAGFLLQSAVALALAGVVLCPIIVWRVRREDRFLEGVYGDEHRAFTARVGCLIPFVIRRHHGRKTRWGQRGQ